MEQTRDTQIISNAELTALRQHLTQRMLTKVLQWARAIEEMDAPATAQAIVQQCRAVSALMGVVHKLIPQRKPAKGEADDPTSDALDALLADLESHTPDGEPQDAPPLNRQQRRRAEAMTRKQGR